MNDFFRFLRRFATPYKWHIVFSIFFNLLTAFFTLFSFAFIIPILQMLFELDNKTYSYMELGSGSLQDVLMNNFYYYISKMIQLEGASTTLLFLGGLLTITTLIKVLSAYASECITLPMSNGIVRNIRNDMYRRIVTLPIGFFTNERTGDIMSRISGDVNELQVSVMSSIYSLVKYPIMIIACLGTMLLLSWQLTIFVLIVLPLIGLVMGIVGKKLKAQNLDIQILFGKILSTVEETIAGLKVIKSFNAEKKMEHLFGSETQTYYQLSNAMGRRYALAHPMSEFLGTLAVAITLWFGGTLILAGNSQLDAAEFIYYMVMFYSLINPAKELSKTSYSVQKGMAALTRIDKILTAENPIRDPKNPKEIPLNSGMRGLKFENVVFSYNGEHNVLQNINLDVKPGQTIAIVGQSGSGKTTLVDLIPRLRDISSGRILIDGADIRDLRVAELRSLMGSVGQEAVLFNDTIFNNIAFGVENATAEDVERAARIANAHDFILETENGYQTMVGDRGSRLSGGQRQRISIARAILRNPAILILDEATSALDAESEHLVQEALENLMKNRTTFVIAHRLATILNADLICVLQNGEIVEQGTHSELIALGGIYHRLVEMQQI